MPERRVMARPGNEHLSHFDPVYFGSGRDGYSFCAAYIETLTGGSKYGAQPVYVFDDGGERPRALWAFHVGLRRAWQEANPEPGQLVAITRSEHPLPINSGKTAQYDYDVRVR
jgi:hypothetical protein